MLGLTWGMILMWKSPCATKAIQSFLRSRRSCIWHLHLVKGYSKENSGAIFQQLHVCLPQRAAASGSGYGQELCYHSVLFQQEKLINLQQFRCLFIPKYIGLLACCMSPFPPANHGQKSLVIIFIYYFSFHTRA